MKLFIPTGASQKCLLDDATLGDSKFSPVGFVVAVIGIMCRDHYDTVLAFAKDPSYRKELRHIQLGYIFFIAPLMPLVRRCIYPLYKIGAFKFQEEFLPYNSLKSFLF